MTVMHVAQDPAPARLLPRRIRTLRGEGQWALGHREPLTPTERIKREDDPMNVRARVEHLYARLGAAAIDPADLHTRLRWVGLHVLDSAGGDDPLFMLRIRTDGGDLHADQVAAVARIAQEYGHDTAALTARQNLQIYGVRIEDVPEIWRRLEAAGLSTAGASGDGPRGICASPVAGVAVDEVVDPAPAIRRIVDDYVGRPGYTNLPHAFKTSIAWLPDTPYEINDLSFIGVVHPVHGPGFDVRVGGGLSTTAGLAERLGAWVSVTEIPEVWAATVRLFREYGHRRLPQRARLKFLVADWGVARFRDVLEREFLGRPLRDGPAPEPPARPIDHVGVHPQRDGRCYVGVAPGSARMSGTLLADVAGLARMHGSGRIRLTPYHKILILDVPPAAVEPLTAALDRIGLPSRVSPWRRNTSACTGAEFCRLAVVETRKRAARLVAELERRIAGSAPEVTIGLSGCRRACARTPVADIGLIGRMVETPAGETVEGFQVQLGGTTAMSGDHATLGRRIRGLRVTADALPDYVERLVRAYLAGRVGQESFARWVHRAAEDVLRAGALTHPQ